MPRPRKITDDEMVATQENELETTKENVSPETEDDEETNRVGTDQQPSPVSMESLYAEIEKLKAQLAAKDSGTNHSGTPMDDMVELMYLSNVSNDNVLDLGDFGTLNGVGGMIDVPRKDFGGKFMTPFVRKLLQKRRLIVLNGLTREERQRYGVLYSDGETLDIQTFDKLLDLQLPELEKVFSRLCSDHQQIAATRFITAYECGDNRVSRDKIARMNELSKANFPDGLFRSTIEKMNRNEL